MKKSDIKNQIKNSLSSSAPSDFNSVWEKCETPNTELVLSTQTATAGGITTPARKDKSPILFAGLIVAVLVVSLVLRFLLPAFNGPAPFSDGVLVLDVNPSIEIDYDVNGNVTAVNGLNDDGKALISGLDFTDKVVEEVVKTIVSQCVKLGYFSLNRDNNAILVTAETHSGAKDDVMMEKAKTIVREAFTSRNMRGVVISAITDKELKEQAETYGITAQKYALIQEYLDKGGELDESEYATVSVSNLYKMLSEKNSQIKTDKADLLKQQLVTISDELYQLVGEKIVEVIDNIGNAHQSLEVWQDKAESIQALKDGITDENIMEVFDTAKPIIADILAEIDELASSPQTNLAFRLALQTAKVEIELIVATAYALANEITSKIAGFQEIADIRLNIFGVDDETGEEFDYDDWLELVKDDYESDWYSLKSAWAQEREKDFIN